MNYVRAWKVQCVIWTTPQSREAERAQRSQVYLVTLLVFGSRRVSDRRMSVDRRHW
jgi:hypothetical protein